jgi:hypothetical protein
MRHIAIAKPIDLILNVICASRSGEILGGLLQLPPLLPVGTSGDSPPQFFDVAHHLESSTEDLAIRPPMILLRRLTCSFRPVQDAAAPCAMVSSAISPRSSRWGSYHSP